MLPLAKLQKDYAAPKTEDSNNRHEGEPENNDKVFGTYHLAMWQVQGHRDGLKGKLLPSPTKSLFPSQSQPQSSLSTLLSSQAEGTSKDTLVVGTDISFGTASEAQLARKGLNIERARVETAVFNPVQTTTVPELFPIAL